jgi:uncharacterized membrane protein YgcG
MSAQIYDDRGEGPARPPSRRADRKPPRGRLARVRAHIRRLLAYLGAFALLALMALIPASGGVLAASPGPPFPPPPTTGTSHVVDTANAFSASARANADSLIQPIEGAVAGPIVVYAQAKAVGATGTAAIDARTLLAQWQPGGSDARAAVLLLDIDPSGAWGYAGLAVTDGFSAFLPADEQLAIVNDSMAEFLAAGNFDAALTAGLSRLSLDVQVMAGGGCVASRCPTRPPVAAPAPGASLVAGATRAPTLSPTAPPAALPLPPAVQPGPPYPPPIPGKRVYDYAGVFRSDTLARTQATADAIEQRTGAQVVVYTQLKPSADAAQAEQDAIDLIDQWGVGRRGFDDGLVILFDLDLSRRHGQVQLYAGPGFRAAFLSNDERQAIFDNDMLPLLRRGDLDGAVLIAMDRVNAAATPAHAQSLQFARQVNAALGLVGAPLVFLLLGGWAVLAWFRHGRDPHYLDDASVYAAGPPADLTPASGAFVLDGGSSRRALTTALLDLASRGEVSFREAADDEPGLVGLDVVHGRVDSTSAAIANARPLGAAEATALEDLRGLGRDKPDGYLVGRDLQAFAGSVDRFDAALERQVIAGGWYKEPPRISRNRWLGRGALEIFLGIVLWFVAALITSSGLTLVAVGVIAAGILTLLLSRSMPTKTMAGAMVQAMLAAYRRTLAKTMQTARSLNQVVAEAQLPWLRTPDQAMVWATAVGLQSQVAGVLQRSLMDISANRALASTTYFPSWYLAGGAAEAGGASSGGGISEPSGGMFSGSMVPNFGGMLAALGTIGNPPPSVSSSSSGGGFSSGGSFGGGSSGGGGGGAGGGF